MDAEAQPSGHPSVCQRQLYLCKTRTRIADNEHSNLRVATDGAAGSATGDDVGASRAGCVSYGFCLLYLCAIDVDNVDHWEPLQIQSE